MSNPSRAKQTIHPHNMSVQRNSNPREDVGEFKKLSQPMA
jgi:hypothetical protein